MFILEIEPLFISQFWVVKKSNIIRYWDHFCAEASTPKYKYRMSKMRNSRTCKKMNVAQRQFLLDMS